MAEPHAPDEFATVKSQWQQHFSNYSKHQFTNEQLQIMLQQHRSIAARLRHTLLTETVGTLVLLTLTLLFFRYKGLPVTFWWWVGIAFFAVGYHLFLLWQHRNDGQLLTNNLQKNIGLLARRMRFMITMYRGAGLVLAVLMGYITYFLWPLANTFRLQILLSVTGINAVAGAWFISTWWADRLYGAASRELNELEKQLVGE